MSHAFVLLQRLRQGLMRHAGVDRVMAQVLAAVEPVIESEREGKAGRLRSS